MKDHRLHLTACRRSARHTSPMFRWFKRLFLAAALAALLLFAASPAPAPEPQERVAPPESYHHLLRGRRLQCEEKITAALFGARQAGAARDYFEAVWKE